MPLELKQAICNKYQSTNAEIIIADVDQQFYIRRKAKVQILVCFWNCGGNIGKDCQLCLDDDEA